MCQSKCNFFCTWTAQEFPFLVHCTVESHAPWAYSRETGYAGLGLAWPKAAIKRAGKEGNEKIHGLKCSLRMKREKNDKSPLQKDAIIL